MTQDLFLSHSDRLWNWCKQKKLFSSIDITRYSLEHYYLRSGRTCRQWSELKEKTGIEPKLNRLSTQEKICRGLIKDGNQNIAWYELRQPVKPKYKWSVR